MKPIKNWQEAIRDEIVKLDFLADYCKCCAESKHAPDIDLVAHQISGIACRLEVAIGGRGCKPTAAGLQDSTGIRFQARRR